MSSIIPTVPTEGYGPCCPVGLPLYARIIRYNENAFWGVAHSSNDQYENRIVWTMRERQEIAYWLGEAQGEIEQTMGFPACARWIEDVRKYRRNPIWTTQKRVIEGGVETVQTLEDGATVSHAADPATIAVTVAATLDINQVHVRYPDVEEYEICPSAIDLTGTTLTISIPRARLVTIAAQETVTEDHRIGVDYSTLSNFLTTVDVVRVYNDPSTQVVFVWEACEDGCDETTQTGCMYVRNAKLGSVNVRPATYTGGRWVRTRITCGCPDKVRLFYRAGFETPTRQVVDAIIRLAHVKMPAEVCGNLSAQYMWIRDRHIPDTLSRERYNCPYGMADGAWTAYKYALSMRKVRGRQLSTGRSL